MSADARMVGLEADIDARLLDLWTVLWRDGAEPNESVAACMRTAYATGYRDALAEDSTGNRGQLHREHGYAHP